MKYCAVFMLCFLCIILHDVDALTREQKKAAKQLKRCYFHQKYPCQYSDTQAGKVVCLDRKLLCDGQAHCPNEDDEANCDHQQQLTNVALGKPVMLSSVQSDDRPANAMVDGDACMSNVFASTKFTPNPWALIDLLESHDIKSVTFQPHYSFPVPNLTIEVGDDHDKMKTCYHYAHKLDHLMKFDMETKCQGRYVRFSVDSAEPLYFTIVETEVLSLE